nr:MAG TPA: hypothetical protein [Caudoviricetes sp.]
MKRFKVYKPVSQTLHSGTVPGVTSGNAVYIAAFVPSYILYHSCSDLSIVI